MKCRYLLPCLLLAAGCGATRLPHIEMAPITIQVSSDGLGIDGLTALEILERAKDHSDKGDLETADRMIRFVLTRFQEPEAQASALYELGQNQLRYERYSEALSTFDTLVRRYPSAPESLDGLFKRALCYEEIGAHRKALRSLKRIWLADGFDVHDRYTLDLQTGITKVRMGRERAGLKLIEQGLAATENTELIPWLRAKAHITKARVLLDAAATLPLKGREKRVVENLNERARLIQQAEKEVTLATRHKEPEWILEGLLILGRSFEALGTAIAESPAPKSLSAEATAYYKEQIQVKGEQFKVKAWHHYDEGVALALRVGYRGMRLQRLEDARETLILKKAIAPKPVSDPTIDSSTPAENTSEEDLNEGSDTGEDVSPDQENTLEVHTP